MNDLVDKLIRDMQEHGDQASWDWAADERFANLIGDAQAAVLIRAAIDSPASVLHRWAAVHVTDIPKKRLSALRRLEKCGYVRAYWVGLGPGSRRKWIMPRGNLRETKIRRALETVAGELAIIEDCQAFAAIRVRQAQDRTGLQSLLGPALDEIELSRQAIEQARIQVGFALDELMEWLCN